MNNLPKALFLLIILIGSSPSVYSQMERQRANPDRPINDIFLATRITGMSSVTLMEKGDLNYMIMHNFGEISSGIDNFFGIDEGANVRMAFEYGLSDKLNIGIARTSVDDNIDFTAKYALIQQTESGSSPISLVLKGNAGITTEKSYDINFVERLNYLGSIMIAKKFNEKFSLQLAPMVAHFNTIFPQLNDELYNTTLGLGLAGRIKLSERKSITFEYLPVIGDKNPGVANHGSLTYEIETGGHVFQMFLMSGRMFTEQHLLARNKVDYFAGDFRLGFNINRVFGLAK